MVLPFRKTLFWIHLVVGLVVGLVVAIMSVTGVAIAFERQTLEWAEAGSRTVSAPGPDAPRLPLEALVAKAREAKPDAQVSGITVFPSETTAVQVALGRAGVVFVNPYTGEVRESDAKGWRAFFQVMTEWHRWVAMAGDNRPVGKAITGACNAGFLFLALSGLYLWWPRKWTLKTVRPVLWFRRGLKGKPRDFNWHNVIGFWTLPVLIVLTASGMVISYKWASDFVYTLTGNTPPGQQGPGGAGVKVTPPTEDAPRKDLGSMLGVVEARTPAWTSITYRVPSPPREGKGGKPDAAVDAVTFNLKQEGWPYFATTQVSVNPFSGEVARSEGYADFNSGRKLRTWLRFLHTGEALGWPGQLIAAIASLGGVFLVWTGFALSWRRFFAKRQPRDTVASPSGTPETSA
ncbi:MULTISPECIES: PepSY-associated TM helix domain-containing protein [Myxococcus]|uniref:PepSY-associated TM helix domain-containing protein n=1 Tax=Myxococcus TaxID=32 RepID=UPI0011420A04|nr:MULTISPECIES: PepSY-associated TM helix domain-containing protein [Myxococcus]MCK8498342.1 PepSY domain-containing protein [Myxococcus fulvus]